MARSTHKGSKLPLAKAVEQHRKEAAERLRAEKDEKGVPKPPGSKALH
jgi:hypothetical protein